MNKAYRVFGIAHHFTFNFAYILSDGLDRLLLLRIKTFKM